MKPITIYACPLYMPTPFPAFIIIQHIRMKPLNKSLLHLNQVQCKTLHYCMQLQVHAFLMNYTSSEVLTDLKRDCTIAPLQTTHVSLHLLYYRYMYYNFLLLCMNSIIVFTSSTNAPEGVTSLLCLIFRLFKHCKCFSQPALSDCKVCTVSDNMLTLFLLDPNLSDCNKSINSPKTLSARFSGAT